MDSDVELTPKDRDFAKKNKITIIQSAPCCLEGMLLDALGEQVPAGNRACKRKLHPMLSGPPTDKNSYANLIPQDFVDCSKKEQLIALRELMSNTKIKQSK